VDSHDAVVGLALLDHETHPVTVLGDCAYGSGPARAALVDAGHRAVIKPIPLRTPIPGGFSTDDFDVDLDRGTVTCPAGHTVVIRPSHRAAFERFCRGCPLAPRCTTAKRGRKLTIHQHEKLLRAARREAETEQFQQVYRHRPRVDRSIAWLTRGNRRLRYRGVASNDRWLHTRVAALNLRRLIILGLTRDTGTWTITTS
jgi:hypothetical protein